MDPKMKQLFWNLFVNFIAGLWLSLKVAQGDIFEPISDVAYCFKTSSRIICFETTIDGNGTVVREPFEEANRRCKKILPGYSFMIAIDSLEEYKTAVEIFIAGQSLQNETIITDGRMLSESESQTWSWVNGHPYSPDDGPSKDVMDTAEPFHDAACVELKRGQSLTYCFDNASTKLSFICEDSGFSHRDNYSYTANEGQATWYDARKNCLTNGRDLAYLHDLRTIEKFPRLKEDQKYWIGLHRNKWIWDRTGIALNYTNWENGFPDESSDKKCLCINSKCWVESGRSTCEAGNDRKWRTCNCNNSYALVCQSDADPPTPRFPRPTPIKTSSNTPSNGIATSTSRPTSSPEPAIPSSTDATTDSYHTAKVTASTSPPNKSFGHQTTDFPSPPKGQENSFITTGILLILLFVAVVIIIVAVIFIIRKRKHDRRHEESAMENVKQGETLTNVYATVVPGNGLSEGTDPAGNTMHAEVDMSQEKKTSNTIDASVQPYSETIDMGKNVV